MSEQQRRRAVYAAETRRALRCLRLAADAAPDDRSRRWVGVLARMLERVVTRDSFNESKGQS